MTEVWLVNEGDYTGVSVAGVYESLEAAEAHHPGDWHWHCGTRRLGDSSGGKYVEAVEVEGMPND